MPNTQPVPLTDEQKKDFETRAISVQEKIKVILQEAQMEIIAQPALQNTPVGSVITANIGFKDTKFAPKNEVPTIEAEVIKENA